MSSLLQISVCWRVDAPSTLNRWISWFPKVLHPSRLAPYQVQMRLLRRYKWPDKSVIGVVTWKTCTKINMASINCRVLEHYCFVSDSTSVPRVTSQGANPNTAADSGAFGVGFTQVGMVEAVMVTLGEKDMCSNCWWLLIGLWWHRGWWCWWWWWCYAHCFGMFWCFQEYGRTSSIIQVYTLVSLIIWSESKLKSTWFKWIEHQWHKMWQV